jgi:hypothetical protein
VPDLTPFDKVMMGNREPAEMLVFNTPSLAATLRALAIYHPSLLRSTVLRSGDYTLHASLISLGVFAHRPGG